MNKKIIIIAEIVFALIFVILLSIFMMTIIRKGNSSNTHLVDTMQELGYTSVRYHDEATSTGGKVENAIKNSKSIPRTADTKLEMDVYSATGMSVKYGDAYGYVENKQSNYTSYKNQDTTDESYINPSARFNSHIVYNTNNVPIGIVFIQEGNT